MYIDKNGTVEDMLQEAAREVCVSHLTDVLLFFYSNFFVHRLLLVKAVHSS